MSIVYGPVPSWRLGRSLGVDAVSTPSKTCSFDCIYCQLGRTRHPSPADGGYKIGMERQVFVQPSQLRQELAEIGETPIDYVTFSGMAEPTLAANLGELVAVVREWFMQPVAVLTNSSLMKRGDVRRDLALFDVVVAKVDAPDEALYRQINRPLVSYSLAEVLWGIRHFREEFQGKLALQMMFVEANRHRAEEMAETARDLSPDEVQLNTPLRPSPVPPLGPAEMDEIEAAFAGLPVLNVYKVARPEVVFLDEEETRRRRPQQEVERR
jgi:wyosine [tRNA(Phe)-imidazoG37] synthetase (radical SAM superfamily)